MGCDIHMYVEYKKELPIKDSKKREEKWISGDYFKLNPYKDIWDGEEEEEFEKIELYGGRNYGLFATLAGVRDYSNLIIPISNPKGIPHNCCDYVKKANKNWGIDGHTHSWLTLKEIKDYQATQPLLPRKGFISPIDVIEFDKNGTHPESWCQGTNMKGYEEREWVEKNETLIPLIELMEKRAKELMQYNYEEYDTKNDEKIRIVFWFDN